MRELVQYKHCGCYSIITMDDGKANVVSSTMTEQLNSALDRAQNDENVVIVTGRVNFFSGGFDLKAFDQPEIAMEMFKKGAETVERLLSFPQPVVIACNGHAIAMGAFLVLSGDTRIGVHGNGKICVNEVEIGLTLPHFAVETCRQRLAPAHFNRALITAAPYNHKQAQEAGFLDVVAAESELMSAAIAEAERLAKLDRKSFVATKLRVREVAMEAVAMGINLDKSNWQQ